MQEPKKKKHVALWAVLAAVLVLLIAACNYLYLSGNYKAVLVFAGFGQDEPTAVAGRTEPETTTPTKTTTTTTTATTTQTVELPPDLEIPKEEFTSAKAREAGNSVTHVFAGSTFSLQNVGNGKYLAASAQKQQYKAQEIYYAALYLSESSTAAEYTAESIGSAYGIHSLGSLGYWLNIWGASPKAGLVVNLYFRKADDATLQWQLLDAGNGSYYIASGSKPNLVVTVGVDDSITLQENIHSDLQKWNIDR
ncbi:MAG: hypothetical protein LBS96_08780 [Oscillospiraceae bacterium]|nr:hypothetical protein [Oscillospiraceae bacterium]